MKTDGHAVYAVLGTEIESEVNYAMPVKVGSNDGAGDNRFRTMAPETANLINTITGSRLTIDDMRKESREEGIESAFLKNIRTVMARLKCNAQQAINFLEIPAADRQKYLAKLYNPSL